MVMPSCLCKCQPFCSASCFVNICAGWLNRLCGTCQHIGAHHLLHIEVLDLEICVDDYCTFKKKNNLTVGGGAFLIRISPLEISRRANLGKALGIDIWQLTNVNWACGWCAPILPSSSELQLPILVSNVLGTEVDLCGVLLSARRNSLVLEICVMVNCSDLWPKLQKCLPVIPWPSSKCI